MELALTIVVVLLILLLGVLGVYWGIYRGLLALAGTLLGALLVDLWQTAWEAWIRTVIRPEFPATITWFFAAFMFLVVVVVIGYGSQNLFPPQRLTSQKTLRNQVLGGLIGAINAMFIVGYLLHLVVEISPGSGLIQNSVSSTVGYIMYAWTGWFVLAALLIIAGTIIVRMGIQLQRARALGDIGSGNNHPSSSASAALPEPLQVDPEAQKPEPTSPSFQTAMSEPAQPTPEQAESQKVAPTTSMLHPTTLEPVQATPEQDVPPPEGTRSYPGRAAIDAKSSRTGQPESLEDESSQDEDEPFMPAFEVPQIEPAKPVPDVSPHYPASSESAKTERLEAQDTEEKQASATPTDKDNKDWRQPDTHETTAASPSTSSDTGWDMPESLWDVTPAKPALTKPAPTDEPEDKPEKAGESTPTDTDAGTQSTNADVSGDQKDTDKDTDDQGTAQQPDKQS